VGAVGARALPPRAPPAYTPPMSLPHALLTSLLEKPSSGYDLAGRFDKSIGYFWHATHQQIYRELARMEAAGWIESLPAPDAGAGRKKLYTVQSKGRKELERWAMASTVPMDLRDALMVKLRVAAALPGLDLAPELRAQIARHEAQLAIYRGIEARDFPPGRPLSRAQALQRLILRKGVMYEEAEAAWGREVLAALEAPIASDAQPTR